MSFWLRLGGSPPWRCPGLPSQVRELQRLLGKKTLEALKEALEHAMGQKWGKKKLRLPPKDDSR